MNAISDVNAVDYVRGELSERDRMGVVAFDDRCAVAAVRCAEMEMVMLFSNDSIAQVFCFPQAAMYVGEQ